MDHPGLVAIVTGASGGVGRAVVADLVTRGMSVVAEDVSPGVAELAGPGVATMSGDVRDLRTARSAISLAIDRFGRLDVIVNNAGVFLSARLEDTTEDDWDRVMAVNTRGAFLHTREALPLLRQSPSASIVNVASIVGMVGIARQFAYAATKGAVVQMTKVAAVELASEGIRVNAVAPGGIDTPFTAEMIAGIENVEAYRRSVEARHPRGKISTPAEVAAVIGFLASPESVSMTGAIIPVDGGYTAQ